jgi:hypothetical protein
MSASANSRSDAPSELVQPTATTHLLAEASGAAAGVKVNCRRRRSDSRFCDTGNVKSRLWKKTLPFNVTPRGILVHRVRMGTTHFYSGEYSHDSVSYWCANGTAGEGVNLVAEPPKGKLLCAHCERMAVAAGELPTDKLVGRHVCIGVLRPHRLCCGHEQN